MNTSAIVKPRVTPAHKASRRLALFALLLAALLIVPQDALAQARSLTPSSPPKPTQCLRATPALTYVATPGVPERADSTWAIVALFDDGSVRRPLLPPRHSTYGRWQLRHDTLSLIVSDGFVGWDVAAKVIPSGAYAGIATYLTDVRMDGAVPDRIPVALRETVCPAAPPA